MTDLDNIHKLFKKYGYEWVFVNGKRMPTKDEINKTVQMMTEALKDEPDQAQIELGRLIVKKREGLFDIFLHVGQA